MGITDAKQLESHPLKGALFENMVVIEMVKQQFNSGNTNNLFFYRDKSQREVDIIQIEGNQLKAYEVKSAQRYDSSFFNNLKYIKNLFGEQVVSTQVIYDGETNDFNPDNGIFNFRNFFTFAQSIKEK